MSERAWRPIKHFKTIYSISNDGLVRRDASGRGTVAGRILTVKKNKKGYGHVDLSRNDQKKRRLIHQLVAEAFLPIRPSPEHFPNHLDGNKLNNRAANLEWATRAENNAHARRLGLVTGCKGEKNGRAKLTESQVREIRALKGTLGARVIARRFGVSRSTVQFIHQNKHWPEDLRVRELPEVMAGWRKGNRTETKMKCR